MKRRVKYIAHSFDARVRRMVSEVLGSDFSDLDSGKFDFDDVLGLLLYDGRPILLASDSGLIKVVDNG